MFPLFSGNGVDTAAIISMPQWCSALRWYMHTLEKCKCVFSPNGVCLLYTPKLLFMSSIIHLNLYNKIRYPLPGYPTCTTIWVPLMLFTECLCTHLCISECCLPSAWGGFRPAVTPHSYPYPVEYFHHSQCSIEGGLGCCGRVGIKSLYLTEPWHLQ